MYTLFLESDAAGKIRDYAKAKGLNEGWVEETLKSAYDNKLADFNDDQEKLDNFWVSKCFDNDSHKLITLSQMFYWADSPQGDIFWGSIEVNGGRW